jgi:hypothetical protein
MMPTPIGYPLNPLKSVQDYTDQYDQAALRQQQIKTNALSFEDRQRALAESQALRNALQSGIDPRTPEGQQKLMTVAPNAAGPVIKSLTDAANVQSQTLLHGAQTNEAAARTAKTNWEQQIAKANKAIADISALSSPDEAVKGITDQVKSGALDMQKATALLQSIPQDPAQFGQWQRKMLLGILDAKERLAETKPINVQTEQGGTIGFWTIDPLTGKRTPMGETPRTESPDAQLAATSRLEAARIAANTRQDNQPPVAVLDPATGEAKFVSRADAIGKTPANMGVELSPKDKQKREAAYPTATTAVKQFDATSTELEKDLGKLRDHPGLSSITGIAAGRLPGLTADGRAAQALFDKIQARGGFSELANLKSAGGTLGQVSNAEGQFLRAAFAAIDRRQNAGDVQNAIDDAIEKVRTSRKNIRDQYDLTYEYRGGKTEKTPTRPPLDSFKR